MGKVVMPIQGPFLRVKNVVVLFNMKREATIGKTISVSVLAMLVVIFSVTSSAAKSSDQSTLTRPCFVKISMPMVAQAERTDNLGGAFKQVQHIGSPAVHNSETVIIEVGLLTPEALTVNAHAQNAIYILPSIHAP